MRGVRGPWSEASRLVAIAAAIAVGTGCFEGFDALETRVVFDPASQSFAVERRIVGVSAAFLACYDQEACAAAVSRLRALSPDPAGGPADRLLQHLLESGARELAVAVHVAGQQVDATLTYTAPLGTAAADDTWVHAEWFGRGDRGDYQLVLDAQPSMTPPEKFTTRRVARVGSAGAEWAEQWVLPPRRLEASTRMIVADAPDLLAEHPGLAAVLGLPSPVPSPAPSPAPEPVAAAPVAPAPAPVAPRPAPAPVVPAAVVAAPRPAAPAAPAAPPPAPPAIPAPPPAPAPAPRPAADDGWLPPDPTSPARARTWDVTVTGGGLSIPAATQATAPLLPRVARCYQDRHAQDDSVTGSLFLSALVAPDGSLVSTSVFGPLHDPPLIACLERVVATWRFPGWVGGDAPSEVTLPILFRTEAPPPTGRKRR